MNSTPYPDSPTGRKSGSKRPQWIVLKPSARDGTAMLPGTLRLFQRVRDDGTLFEFWYARLDLPGKPRALKSLKVRDLASAKVEGALFWKMSCAEDIKLKAKLTALLDGRAECSTLGEIYAAYLHGMGEGQYSKLARANVNAHRQVVARGMGLPVPVRTWKPEQWEVWREKIDAQPGSVLTEKLVENYFTARLTERGLPASGMWKTERQEHVSFNSTLNSARGLFTAEALRRFYGELVLPDVDGFMSSGYLPVPPAKPEEVDMNAVRCLVHDLPALRQVDAEAWLFLSFIALMGLRNSEVRAARGHWLVQDAGGTWRLDLKHRVDEEIPFKMKGARPGLIAVPDCIMDVVRHRQTWLVCPDGSALDRKENLERRLNAFLRNYFPDTHKCAYLFRGLFSGGVFRQVKAAALARGQSEAVAEMEAEVAASAALRHMPNASRGYAVSSVTRAHYLREGNNLIPCLNWDQLAPDTAGVIEFPTENLKLKQA